MQQLDPKLELPQPPRPLIESNPVAQPYPVQALWKRGQIYFEGINLSPFFDHL